MGWVGPIRQRWRLFWSLRREQGLCRALGVVYRRLRGQRYLPPEAPPRELNRVTDFYSMVFEHPFGEGEVPPAESRTLNWVIPDFHVGSGGHTTIFRLVHLLEKAGYRSRLVIDGPCHFTSAEEARATIRRHFFPLAAEVGLGCEALRPAWATIATAWTTAYRVRDYRATRVKCYLVQDLEPRFHAMGSDYLFAEETYRMGLYGITAGDWLAARMRDDYGMQAEAFHFGVDHHLYHPRERSVGDTAQRVFFYARPVTPRRGFELGMLALAELCRRMPEVEVVFAGWDLSSYHIPFRHRSLGTVSPMALGEAMASCDAALVLSLTNLSLLPLEAMACGCPVVSNQGPHVEWLLEDGQNALLCPATPEALARGLERVLGTPGLHARLRRSGIEFAAGMHWQDQANEVRAIFERLAAT